MLIVEEVPTAPMQALHGTGQRLHIVLVGLGTTALTIAALPRQSVRSRSPATIFGEWRWAGVHGMRQVCCDTFA